MDASQPDDRDDGQADPALDLAANLAELAGGEGDEVRDLLDSATGDATVTEAMSFGISAATSMVESRRALRQAGATQGDGEPAIRALDVRDEQGQLVGLRFVVSDPEAAVGISDGAVLICGDGYTIEEDLPATPADVTNFPEQGGVAEAVVEFTEPVEPAGTSTSTEQLLDADVDVDEIESGTSSSVGPGSDVVDVEAEDVRTGEPDADQDDVPDDLAELLEEHGYDVDDLDDLASDDEEGASPED